MQGKKVTRMDILCALFVRSYDSGVLTLADRYTLRSLLLSDLLCEEEQRLVNRILHAVRRNWIVMNSRTSVSENYFVA